MISLAQADFVNFHEYSIAIDDESNIQQHTHTTAQMFSLDYYQVFPLNQILLYAVLCCAKHAWIDDTNWQNIVCVVAHRKVEIGSLKGYSKWEKKKRAENTCTPSITLMQTLAKEKNTASDIGFG